MKQRATAYLRADNIYIHAASVTTDGVGIATQPFISMVAGSDSNVVGEAILEALSASSEGVPHPVSWGKILDPLLKAASCRSWPVFASKAKCCEIVIDGDCLSMIPTRRRSEDNSFEHLVDEAVSAKQLLPGALGESLLRCFELSKDA